jgi:hypothetical protein
VTIPVQVRNAIKEVAMELDIELKYYEAHKTDFLKAHRGQVVLIRGETTVGIFPTEEEAYQAGIRQFGNLPFLIARAEEGLTPHPAGQQLLRQMGFLAQAGMTDEDIDRFVAAIYEERSHQQPREVDFG